MVLKPGSVRALRGISETSFSSRVIGKVCSFLSRTHLILYCVSVDVASKSFFPDFRRLPYFAIILSF